MSFVRGQKIRLLTKQGQSLEGWVLSFSTKEIWLQNEKNEMIWIPQPYENVGMAKVLPEEIGFQTPYRTNQEPELEFHEAEEEISSQENFIPPKKYHGLNLEEQIRRDLPRLKQRLAESGLSFEDLQNQYSLPNFGQHNVSPPFPSAPQYSGTEASRHSNRVAPKMR